ncbi:AAA family ATPase [Legionella taurinensis]|nr:UvrD-helicase domain-containing protein [Legionella taurinensis]
MQNVLYWQEVLGDSDYLIQYRDVVSKLLNGDYKEADLEKLAGHNVYSVRVNHSDRLLFTTVTVNGKSCLLLLDVVLNHDYHKSRFLKPQVLRQFLEQNVPEAISKGELTFVKADSLPALWANPQSKEEEEPIEYQKATFYNQTFITLSDIQEKAVKTPLPAVISGAAGSGKSCVALAILEQAVNQYTEVPEKPLLYVTQSAKLAETMHSMWLQLPAAQTEAGKKVQFLTYQQFLAQEASELKHKKAQDKTDFMTWLDNHIASYLNAAKAAKQTLSKDFQDFLKNTESMYQAFRYLSGYLPDNPGGISARHEQFKNDNERQWLINAYTSYKKTHDNEKNTAFHPEFHTLKQSDRFDLVVVDEAQDLSGLELKNLRRAARNSQIAYCMDSNQSLKDTLSQRQFLLSSGVSHVELPVTYRCPGHVVDLANAILDIKQRLTGGLADKLEYARIIPSEQQKANPGLVQWVEPNELAKNHRLNQLAQTTQFAVVTLPQWKEKAKELFNTPLVFTPEEIKGLEYPHIAAYRLFDHDTCNDASKKINHTAVKSQQHRAKAEQGDASFAPHFNQLFTAFTRATQSLAIVEDSSVHQRKNLLTPLKQSTLKLTQNPNNNNNNNNPEPKPIPASQQDWINEANKLKHLGKSEQAKAIEQQFTQPNRGVAPSPVVNNPTPTHVPAINLDTGKAKPKDSKKSNKHTKTAKELVKALMEDEPLAITEIQQFINPKRIEELWWNTPYQGQKLFVRVFFSVPQMHKIIKRIGGPELNQAVKTLLTSDRLMASINDGSEKTLLLYMCEDYVRARYLHQIFENNPKLLERCLPHLCARQSIQQDGGEVTTVSPLFYLALKPKLFLILTSQYFMKRIPVETWYQEGTHPGYCKELPLLTALITTLWHSRENEKEIAAIVDVLTPRLVEAGFPLASLCKEGMLMKSDEYLSISFLQALPLLPEGVNLLWTLMNACPKSFAQIPLEIWLGRTNQSAPAHSVSNKASVYNLIDLLAFHCTREMPTIDKLLDLYPDLPFAMPAKMLYRHYDESGASLINVLAFQCAYESSNFLPSLAKRNPALIREIPIETWYAHPAKDVIPPLYSLCASPKGIEVIFCLMKECPDLLQRVPIEFWHQSLRRIGTENHSPLDFLLKHDPDRTLVDPIIRAAGKDRFSQWAANDKTLASLADVFFPESGPLAAAMNAQGSALFFSPTAAKEDHLPESEPVQEKTMEPGN